jgi:ANTAR domain
MAHSDLAQETADLLSVANGSGPRSLNQLVDVAVRQVPACSGAVAVQWRGGEQVLLVSSHPDLPELIEVELSSGRGPALDALAAEGRQVSCPDTLAEYRWPEYASAALRRGVRCSVTLACLSGQEAVTLSLFGARPRLLDGQLELAELLTAFGGAVMGNAAQYGGARRTALHLEASAASRTVVDQAKGMLMQALGCSAEEALDRMKQISQAQNTKVTEVASRIIDSRGTDWRK